MKKPFPKFKSVKEHDEWFEKTDLGEYLEPSDLISVNFQLRKQDKTISLRLSSELLDLLRKAASKHQTKYQKLIRSILEQNIKRYL